MLSLVLLSTTNLLKNKGLKQNMNDKASPGQKFLDPELRNTCITVPVGRS